MCSDHHFANNHMYFQLQPNQSFPRITDACTYLEGATHEQSFNGRQEAGDDSGTTDPRTVLTYLTFLEQKIGHLRGILCSTPHPQQQIVSAELSCIIVQLISISKSLVSGAGGEEAAPDDARSPSFNAAQELMGGDDSDDQDGHHADADEEEEHHPLPPAGSYEVVQIEEEEILAPHVHSCKVCGKGFKRDANLRMHMRGHGDEYKTAAALARPPGSTTSTRDTVHMAPAPETARRCFYSCPYVGCKRNREHRDFQPLKTAVCVKNHYRRRHCDKRYTCRRCNVKKFSVLADLRTHEKHCGRDRWVCSCGTSFSRKDKLFGHVAVFDGHTPALPLEDAAAAATATATATGFSGGNGNGNGTGSGMPGSGQLLAGSENSTSTTVNMDQCFSDSMFNDFRCSDIKGSMDDGRGYLSPMGLDSCDFDGFDLFGTHAIDFDF